MNRWFNNSCYLIVIALNIWIQSAAAGEIHAAVASNFSLTMERLVHLFLEKTGNRIVISRGATGRHYAQISHGAPFDLFFAADKKRPSLLERQGLAVSGSRFTYAVGKVALWSQRVGYVDPDGDILRNGNFRHLAIANPKLAPYGMAAKQVLTSLGEWDRLLPRLVRGENIGQTFQFVASGNATLGFVALSQIRRPEAKTGGSFWEIPLDMYQPIEQQAVLLNTGENREVAAQFLEFVKKDAGARKIITKFGYGVP
ncbi:MAG: molybdate ABC transporter substrate-binding protein [Gammaproteobacteria bacterium]|nr:molybdate ABC transporter substrate-binding protein [Gammaproteobacteria bacterium]